MFYYKIGLICTLSLLAGCSWLYKMDVQQGNVITQEMLSQLQQGMNKRKVRFIMGTPLIQDVFHPERWDYVYRLEQKMKAVEQRRVTLVFQDDQLIKVIGDVETSLPSTPPQQNEQEETSPLL